MHNFLSVGKMYNVSSAGNVQRLKCGTPVTNVQSPGCGEDLQRLQRGECRDAFDEQKLQSAMGIGRALFGNFVDLKLLAQSCGYYDYGVAQLTGAVLGWQYKKQKKVCRLRPHPRPCSGPLCRTSLYNMLTTSLELPLWWLQLRGQQACMSSR